MIIITFTYRLIPYNILMLTKSINIYEKISLIKKKLVDILLFIILCQFLLYFLEKLQNTKCNEIFMMWFVLTYSFSFISVLIKPH